MAREWSDDCKVADHRELQANTLALDGTGQYAVLAGRRHMGIVHLDNPAVTICKVNRNSKWDVTCAQWSPHLPELFAISCNQRAELYNWQEGNVLQYASLRAHTRAISDLDWATFDSNMIATASIDAYIHVWDIRDFRKPASSLSAVAGASQVKWNKVSPHSVATAHEGDIRLWDTRKFSNPIKYITAHLSKIHSIDWCPTQDSLIATASQDCTVKFWDIASPQKKDEMISLRCPVWRVQYTPFSNGLITAVVPPLRRGDNSLFFWNLTDISNPVYTFLGHTDVITEFGWRKRAQESKDYQLVTWSKDQKLRLWTVDEHLQKSCGLPYGNSENPTDIKNDEYFVEEAETVISEKDTEITEDPSYIDQEQEKNTVVNTPVMMSQPQNLQQEFSLVNSNIPNMTIDEMDASKRTCIVTAENGKNIVCLKMTFPESYPFNAAPVFIFRKQTNVDEKTREKILQVLHVVSKQQVRRNKSCLEPCLRQLVNTLTSCTSSERPTPSDSPYHREPALSGFGFYGFQDVSVPFPRTSGARFCGSDLLVVFTRPPHLQRINAPTDVTPRSLSALAAYLSSHVLPMKPRATSSSPAQYNLVYPPITHSPAGDATVSISSFYHQDRKRRVKKNNADRRSSGSKTASNCGAVLVYSVTKLMPISRYLAQNYVLDFNDIHSSCTKNANVAAGEGFDDLVQVWFLCSVIGTGLQVPEYGSEGNAPWSIHPFGKQIIKSLISHFIEKHDVQTAAMLTCMFQGKPCEKIGSRMIIDINNCGNVSPGGSPYHTVVPADLTWDNWILGANLKRNRSNSWSDSLEDYKLMESGFDYRDPDKPPVECYTKFLDVNMSHQYDMYKRAYADMLHRWNLLDQRAQILKYQAVHYQPEKRKGIDFVTECRNCHTDVAAPQCSKCKVITLSCVVCHLGVKGLGSFCLSCGHGGHTSHLEEWFSSMDVCPSGCGCQCLEGTVIFGT